jgi:tetratricopeptide (TPR) repeat protein
VLSLVGAGLAGAACRGDIRDHAEWGDRFLALGRPEAALAEYQVALRQEGDEPEILVRLAHGYAQLDRFDDAAAFYRQLLATDSTYRDQAVVDFLRMARRALARRDSARMTRALEEALAVRPGVVPPDLVEPLALRYYGLGEYERALPWLLAAESDATTGERRTWWFRLGRAYEGLGQCREALDYLRRYLEAGVRGERAPEARWYAGQCAYRLAQEARAVGRPGEALELLDLVVRFGSPPALVDEAWFDRGEILYALARYDEALAAYRQVLELNPSRTGRLVRQAEDRIRAIRFRP